MSQDQIVAILSMSNVWQHLNEKHRAEAVAYYRNVLEEAEQKVYMQSIKKAA